MQDQHPASGLLHWNTMSYQALECLALKCRVLWPLKAALPGTIVAQFALGCNRFLVMLHR
jgi:hypothetical protein